MGRSSSCASRYVNRFLSTPRRLSSLPQCNPLTFLPFPRHFPQEISPFPYAALTSALSVFPSAHTFTWAQEEPENAGAYLFALPRLQQILPDGAKIEYAGRPAMATVAPGVKEYFVEQQKELVEAVFKGL
jgi:hypothetical protein